MTYVGIFSIAVGMYFALPAELFTSLALTTAATPMIDLAAALQEKTKNNNEDDVKINSEVMQTPLFAAPIIIDVVNQHLKAFITQPEQPKPFAMLSYAVGTNLLAQVAWNVATPYVDNQNQFFTQLTLLCLSAFSVYYLHTQRVSIMKPALPFLNLKWLSGAIITVGGVIAAITSPLSQYINIEKWWASPPTEKKKD